jgi:hypothetical protein
MWFQDLFTYDFRRTEMCIIPYGTEEGEISFCAYNTGIGWRQIVEKKHMRSAVPEWYAQHGRHKIYAGDHYVPIGALRHSLRVSTEAIEAAAQSDLHGSGIAKSAREERARVRQSAPQVQPGRADGMAPRTS